MNHKTSFIDRWKPYRQKTSAVLKENTPSFFCSNNIDQSTEMDLLKSRLLNFYRNKSLSEVLDGKISSNDEGSYFYIKTSEPIAIQKNEESLTKNRLLSNLRLINGLGQITENHFHHENIFNLNQIPHTSRFYKEAQKLVKQIEKGPYDDLFWKFYTLLGKSHQDTLQLSRLIKTENLVFMDIETMGLGSQPISLIGIGRVQNDQIVIQQFFAQDIFEESSMLEAFANSIRSSDYFVTFNGEHFDIPFIKNRMRYLGINDKLFNPNFDALFFSRKVWRSTLPNCKLQTIEKEIFDIERTDDVPGAYCPSFYQHYCQTGEIGTVVPIIQHNRQDIVSLALIFFKLRNIWR
ncbi:MAG: ribonuclease H-like domain-containing protein [Caldisericia bacterium]|nr:ribonuclease H-like domain-containing protein [Caldisericia bacterium]